jgi:hypothetical protein
MTNKNSVQKPLVSRWTFWTVLGITFFLGLIGFTWGIPCFLSAGEWPQVLSGMNYFLFPDSYITTPFYHIHEYQVAYPPLHHMIMGLCSLLFFAFEGIKAFLQTHSLSDTKSLLYFIGYSKLWEIMLLGRLVSVALSVINVWIVVRISKLLYHNYAIAITAGFLMGVSLLSVFQAHHAHPEQLTVTMSLATIWALMRVIQNPNTKNYIIAAVMYALAMNAKWNLFPLVLLFPVTYFLAAKAAKTSPLSSRFIKSACIAFVVAVVVLLVIFPTPVLRPDIIQETYRFRMNETNGGYLPYTGSFGSYIFSPVPEFNNPLISGSIIQGIGWPVFFLGLVGMIFAIIRRSYMALLLVVWAVAYYLYMESHSIRVLRMMIVLVPPFAIFASRMLWDILDKIKTPQWANIIIAIGIALPSFSLSARYAYDKTLPDTRIIAKSWIESNIPAGESILVDTYGPPLEKYGHQLKWLNMYKPRLIALFREYFSDKGNRGYRLRTTKRSREDASRGLKAPMVIHMEDARRDSVNYVITCSYYRRIFNNPTVRHFYPESVIGWQSFYQELDQVGEKVYEIRPRKWRETGPEIIVYKLPETKTNEGNIGGSP